MCNGVPRFLPLILLLSVLLWVFTTTGGRQVFVKEVLGGAYDSQAEHFLRGNVDVDAEAIEHEAMIVNDHVRMYFGPFPAFLRIPLNLVYPAGYGEWSRISGFSAGIMALVAFAGLVSTALRSSALSSRARSWLGNACLIGFALGSPFLLLLGNLSIYDEAIIWGLAWSVAALYFTFRSRQTEGSALTRSLLGLSLCAAGALLSRITFGIPFLYADRHFYDYPALFSNPDSEVYISLLWSSSWLVFAAVTGLVCLFRSKAASLFEWGIAVALFMQVLCILSYFLLAQRYSTDLYPFLIFCLVIFLGSGAAAMLWSRYIIVGLVVLSAV